MEASELSCATGLYYSFEQSAYIAVEFDTRLHGEQHSSSCSTTSRTKHNGQCILSYIACDPTSDHRQTYSCPTSSPGDDDIPHTHTGVIGQPRAHSCTAVKSRTIIEQRYDHCTTGHDNQLTSPYCRHSNRTPLQHSTHDSPPHQLQANRTPYCQQQRLHLNVVQ